MARLPRFEFLHQPQHVIQRGNNRAAIFRNAADYRFYLDRLTAGIARHECEVHAYVLMTNHVHLLLTPHREKAIGKIMQLVGRYYVPYYNRRYGRTGTLWEGRYRATLIDTERYLLTCMRYIELNPVRAGMAASPSEYAWSSYHHNALGEQDGLVTSHKEYRRLGETEAERRAAYRSLFGVSVSESCATDIREATNKAWVLGNQGFKRMVARRLQRPASPRPRGGNRRSKKSLARERDGDQ
jgi:putative transposase